MFCVRKTIELEKIDDDVDLRPLGGVHIGNVGFDENAFQRNIDYIANTVNTYTIGMGDFIDNVTAYRGGMVDKRWNPETVDPSLITTEKQIERFVALWTPIAGKTTGLHAGNHEWATINQQRFINDFCKPFGLPYLGRMAYTCLNFKHKNKTIRDYLIFSIHGGFAGGRSGGIINRLEDLTTNFDADVYLMGHTHDTLLKTTERLYYNDQTNDMTIRKCILGNTGTFLSGYKKGVDGYAEINPKASRRVGTITITFNPYKGSLYGHD